MGLLDDAIREHLELKRRRGADSTEVSKQEHEAFGPVRREDIAVDLPDDKGPVLFDDEIADEEPLREPEAAAPPAYTPPPEEPVAYEPPPAPEPAAYEPPPAPPVEPTPQPAAYEPPPERSLYEATPPPPPERPRAAADPLPPVDATPVPPPPEPQETVAFSAIDHEQAADDVVPADDEVGDELEETPDFLEETPEHDRLWFEQKPPRDFDF